VDSRHAKTILSCYRAGVDDAQSEPFAEALAQARQDPALALWLERSLAADAAIGARLREAPVPPDLRARILAAHPAAKPAWWRRPSVAFASLAAVAAVALVVLLLRSGGADDQLGSYRRDMTALVAGEYKLDLEAEDLSRLQAFFASRGWPADYGVPRALVSYPLEGGMAVSWRGHRVSVLCFGAEEDESKDLWLFVIERGAVSGAPASVTPELATASGLATASWAADGRLYLFAGRGDVQALRAYLD
jgi:hypothetical protein